MVHGVPEGYEVAEDQPRRYRLSDYFDSWWSSYAEKPKEFIQPEQYKAVSAMRSCRTEALGVDHYVCTECGEISYVYHSCKNRFCPTCSWKDTLDWADRVKDQLLDIPHRHVVFTVPHGLNGLIKENRRYLLSFLFQVSADTLKDWMWHKHRLTPGIISVLHTFGEKKDYHTHIHMIVSWGGVTSTGTVKEIKGEYISYDFMQTKFRCKFEDKLIELLDAGRLNHKFSSRIEFMQFIKRINKNQWHIQLEPAIRMPSEVIRYVGRYSKRACISEYKITSMDGEHISFRYKDYKNLDYHGRPMVKELTLHYSDFFPRLLQHVPLPYFRLVRYYGVYAARTKAVLKGKYPVRTMQEEPVADPAEAYELPDNPRICKCCHAEKVYLYTVFRTKEGKRVFMSRLNPKRKDDKPEQRAA